MYVIYFLGFNSTKSEYWKSRMLHFFLKLESTALSPDPPNCVFFMPTTSIVVPTKSLPELVDWAYAHHSKSSQILLSDWLKTGGSGAMTWSKAIYPPLHDLSFVHQLYGGQIKSLVGELELKKVVGQDPQAFLSRNRPESKGWPRHFSRCKCEKHCIQREKWSGHPLLSMTSKTGYVSAEYFPGKVACALEID